jgi:hypothetical protein
MSYEKKEGVGEVKGKQTITTTLKDYSNDPFVVKKLEAAKKTLEKYGLPKELLNG